MPLGVLPEHSEQNCKACFQNVTHKEVFTVFILLLTSQLSSQIRKFSSSAEILPWEAELVFVKKKKSEIIVPPLC